ncbi:MAG: 50S ribosomal protein L11 methyltransferase [Desulfatitalea sp.]
MLLKESVGGVPPAVLVRTLIEVFPNIPRRQLWETLKEMARAGEVSYVLRHGSTMISLGSGGLERLSDRIYLCSALGGGSRELTAAAVCVRIASGAAFGTGDHPTTCLALRGVDRAVAALEQSKGLAATSAVDVGTGSGVLAISALLLGIARAVGIDTDPVACYEAQMNARENGVAARFDIIPGSVERLATGPYDLVMANLRPPTLVALMPRLVALTSENGFLVLSGFRVGEQPSVENCLQNRMRAVWREKDRDWAASIAHRKEYDSWG